jgi:hypothetical protein
VRLWGRLPDARALAAGFGVLTAFFFAEPLHIALGLDGKATIIAVLALVAGIAVAGARFMQGSKTAQIALIASAGLCSISHIWYLATYWPARFGDYFPQGSSAELATLAIVSIPAFILFAAPFIALWCATHAKQQ